MNHARPPRPPGRKVLFVKPSSYDGRGRLIRGRRTFFPSRTLPYLAALSPRDWDMRIVDDAVQDLEGQVDADLLVLTGLLPNMPRAMDIARDFRARGATVVIGGIGVFSLGDRLRQSGLFDSVITGEAETIWPVVVDDYRRGRLAPTYDGGRCQDLSGLPAARFDLVELARYWRLPGQPKPWLPIETSRGCPHDCSFCAVKLFFGRQMRYRPVGEVVREMRELGSGYYIITDDNLMANPEHARELFQAIKPLGIRWGGQFDVNAVRHPEILRLAGQSGCRYAGVGIESLTEQNLLDSGKPQNTRLPVEEVVRGFRAAGISMTASMIFGMDHDTPESLEHSVDRLIASGVDFMLPWVLVPGPGSEVHDQLRAQGRLLHENYSLYNGIDVVFQPRHMSPEALAQCSRRGLRRFYRLRHIAGRTLRAAHRAEVLGLSLYFWAMARRGLHPFYGVA